MILFIVIIMICIITITRTIQDNNYKKLKERYVHLEKLCERLQSLEKYSVVKDAYAEASKILREAQEKASSIIEQAHQKRAQAEEDISKGYQKLRDEMQEKSEYAQAIIKNAQEKAREIAGNALDAKENAKTYEQIATSMRNIILGYGNEYLIPSHTLLDNLAETYGYTQASKDYKAIRSQMKSMIKNNQAASCDYSESSRRNTAINFIIDAFNGKADSILAGAKADNFGILKQKLQDAFIIVNQNGTAFRNARINNEYFNLRLEELRLACILNEIRKRDAEEQRRIKEQIREEEKTRREIEKALKEATKEEEILQKAMEKARLQLEEANAEQRATYEAQIAELEKKYQEAEERNKRALSMAQQTKAGHVYIISNEGSFGQDVYKIGMTRRLEPLDRIKELSSASVPFAFDVHALIWSEDAPKLETMLHKKFALYQVNKVNFRKEFFKLPLSEIRAELEKSNLNIKWTMTAEASEYHESLAIEKNIQDNPEAREIWLNHQFNVEANSTEQDEEISDS